MQFASDFRRLLLLLLLQLLTGAAAARAGDDGSMMIGWHDFHLQQHDAAAEATIRSYVKQKDLIIARDNHLGRPQDVLVSPDLVDDFKRLLNQLAVKFDIPETDIGRHLQQERRQNSEQQLSSSSSSSDPSTFFATSPQILAWIHSLAAANSDIASVQSVGKSFEGRDLLLLKLSTDPSANKPIIFIDAAIHAREWLAPATANWIIKKFITEKGTPAVQELLQKYDWYFLPVVNPDGYDFTFESIMNRFWRKTRQPYGSNFGADPNRNFDYQFGGPSTSNNPRSDLYHGPRPFSEPETLALSQFLRGIRSRLVRGMYISLHTYGQMWLNPPGYTRRLPPDHDDMVSLASIGNEAIKATNGISFKIGQPANVGMYEAAGASDDWVKYVLGVKYSYTLELRPRYPAGLLGFLARPSDIRLSGSEIFAGLQAVAKALPARCC